MGKSLQIVLLEGSTSVIWLRTSSLAAGVTAVTAVTALSYHTLQITIRYGLTDIRYLTAYQNV